MVGGGSHLLALGPICVPVPDLCDLLITKKNRKNKKNKKNNDNQSKTYGNYLNSIHLLIVFG